MDQMLAELINAAIVERTTQLWAKNWNKDLRPCSSCTSHALTTERSLLHRDCMERDTKWFYKWLFYSKSFLHLIFILTFKSWVIPFPNVLPQRSFNVDLYRFSEKIKIIGSVKIKKVFKIKKIPTEWLYVFWLYYGNHTYFPFFGLSNVMWNPRWSNFTICIQIYFPLWVAKLPLFNCYIHKYFREIWILCFIAESECLNKFTEIL